MPALKNPNWPATTALKNPNWPAKPAFNNPNCLAKPAYENPNWPAKPVFKNPNWPAMPAFKNPNWPAKGGRLGRSISLKKFWVIFYFFSIFRAHLDPIFNDFWVYFRAKFFQPIFRPIFQSFSWFNFLTQFWAFFRSIFVINFQIKNWKRCHFFKRVGLEIWLYFKWLKMEKNI